MLIKSIIASLSFLVFASITFAKLISLIKESINEKNKNYLSFYILALLNSLALLILYPYIVAKLFSGFLHFPFGIVFILIVNLGVGYKFTYLSFNLIIIPRLKEKDTVKYYLENFSREVISKDKTNIDRNTNSISKIDEYLTKLGFNNVTCIYEKNDNGYASTYIDPKDTKHIIWIHDPCMKMSWEKLSAVLGHELVHIMRKNNTNMDKLRRTLGGTVIFFIPVVSMYIAYTLELYTSNILGTLLMLTSALISLVSFLYMVIYFSFDSRRFWLQIDEIYCDRKACDLPDVKPEYMADALREISSDMENYPKQKWYDRLYISYYMILEHPCIKYRIKLMDNYRKWSMFEYIRHFNVMFLWLITGRGWIGE